MAGGGGGGNLWIIMLVAGLVLVGAGMGLHHVESLPGWVTPTLLALGGLGVVFGSCEAMIKSVEGIGQRLGWNPYVAGTMAGLASNIPEIVMLGFVIAKQPRVAFVVVALTLHVGTMCFGIYSGLLPRDQAGHARLPEPLVKLSTDLYACAGVVYLALGSLMVVMRLFETGNHQGDGLGKLDLVVIGVVLILIQVVAINRLMKRFSADDAPTGDEAAQDTEKVKAATARLATPPSWGNIAFYGVLGMVMSVIGGHAVGDFADVLVGALTEAGYSEMIGAILISIFACTGLLLMIATAHAKGMYDIALANVNGAVTQVPFVVQPLVLILMAAFAQFGVITPMESGAVLPIDLETTSVILFGFPPMLIMWKSINDDGQVNWLETASMVGVFTLIIYFLAAHG